jgi:Xaa-Pro dipeptidase
MTAPPLAAHSAATPPGAASRAGLGYDVRVAALREQMAALELTAVAVASPENIYYLTGLDHLGYFSFTLLVVPLAGPPILITREMERPTIRAQVPHCGHVTFADGADPAEAVLSVLRQEVPTGQTFALEEGAMFFPPAIRERVRVELADRRWCDAGVLLASARSIKSADEIESMVAAAAVSDAAMKIAIETARPGVSEAELAAAIYHRMFLVGGQQPGFSPLIRPLKLLDQEHVTWGDRVLEPGSGLFIELSGCVRRYHAPLSRTVYVRRAPAAAREAHRRCVAGLDAALDALRPGALTGEVYAAWERATGALRPGRRPARHHCGYLVGIGFPPSWVGGGEVLGICAGGSTRLAPGMAFHLMSWVEGHVISDTALVEPTGARLLTSAPRELTVVD